MYFSAILYLCSSILFVLANDISNTLRECVTKLKRETVHEFLTFCSNMRYVPTLGKYNWVENGRNNVVSRTCKHRSTVLQFLRNVHAIEFLENLIQLEIRTYSFSKQNVSTRNPYKPAVAKTDFSINFLQLEESSFEERSAHLIHRLSLSDTCEEYTIFQWCSSAFVLLLKDFDAKRIP